ncbi:hypothetical protein KAK06_15250 [Ideonella sp. 4Y11]|uniref:Putative Flp pilus-assembly TadG-like N-terminal domain-containing protein n=1 Tax=Ideonella aquatica TaxID=2824119 RepID=A0A940YW27_9BURK|nr:pilus assembly protein TadG-related protein [Ideonella aquatica]MBQ0960310.1 hypothetical protein [Ideonella aquatica]
MIWLLGTLSAAAAVMYGVFNVSQLTVAKQRTVNAADAAALAGATVEARLLNLMAYNNRAMMANEAFLVQMLSLESWTQYFSHSADNIGYALDVLGTFVPQVAVAARLLHELAHRANEGHTLLGESITKIVDILEVEKKLIKGSHLMVRSTGSLLAQDAAAAITDANRAQFGQHSDAGVQLDRRPAVLALTLAANEWEWRNFTRQYATTGDDRRDAADVLLASRDGFSASRPGAGWLNFDALLFGLDKDGGSRLKSYERWESQDTLELWVKGLCGKPPRPCKLYTPIGWGRSNADYVGGGGDTWSPRRSAQMLAYKDASRHENWTGVPHVYDVRDKSLSQRGRLGLDFVVVVSRPASNTVTSDALRMGVTTGSVAGSSEMPERLAGHRLSAIGKARVFFERPRRGLPNDFTARSLWRPDSAKEHGSLFSPYWQARLADTSQREKAALLVAMGLAPDAALYTPGGQ